jgi:hypothetical protein
MGKVRHEREGNRRLLKQVKKQAKEAKRRKAAPKARKGAEGKIICRGCGHGGPDLVE